MNSKRRRDGRVTAASLVAAALILGTHQISARDTAWRSVENMAGEYRELFDPVTAAARSSSTSYVPAEPYPFEAPYTAEEMGYRASEFPHVSRWPHMMVDVYGAVTASGYINQGASISYSTYNGRNGLSGYMEDTSPGQIYAKWTLYDQFPPENINAQQLWFLYRSDMESRNKLDLFVYSPQLRRVRRQPEPRRDQRFPDTAQTFDDVIGRDPWELKWELIGTDVLYETVRYPTTRPSITLNIAGRGFVATPTASIKMMGDAFPHYRGDGGVDCWVVEAITKEDWLPDYNEGRLVMWLEKNTFYPLRIEKYGNDGRLMMIEVRVSEMQNPAMGNFGYTSLLATYWNVDHDLLSYSLHDAHTLREWTTEEETTIFNAEFMRREWLIEPLKSQARIESPDQFYVRPHLYPDKFPSHRNVTLPAEIQSRYDAQEAAGRLVFESGGAE